VTEDLVVARVRFRSGTNIIDILDDPEGDGTFAFQVTGTTWIPDQYVNLTIDLNVLAGKIDIFYNGVLIYSIVAVADFGSAVEQVRFDATNGSGPHAMLALPVMAADTDDEAEGYASEITPVRIRLESGRTFTVFSVEAAEEFGRQSQEKFTYEVQEGRVIHGSRETVRLKLLDVQHRYQVDELFIVTAIGNFQKRLRSYELLSQVFTQSAGP